MKQRFSYLDLRLVTNEVQRELTNCYLQNVYSLENSSRHFLFKFDAGVNQTGKRFLMVDPGMRYHFTNYQHEPTKQPSHFVQKLRKYLKNRRTTNFWVAPASRLMVITFTEGQFYLVFEFFAGGNVILLDKEYKILTLFRVVRDVGPGHENYQIGEQYGLEDISKNRELQQPPSIDELRVWVGKDKLGKALYSKISDPSSSLIEYCLYDLGLDPKQKLDENASEEQLNTVMKAVKNSLERAHTLINNNKSTPGYILYDENGNSLEFEPFAEYFEHFHPNKKVGSYPTYNETVDKYFGAILSDKGVNKVEQLHALADSRLEAARNERQKRVEGLIAQQKKNEEMGNKIQENADVVESAISAVKALVDQGADWGDAESLIKLEQEKGNVIAQAIHSLQLDNSQVTLLFDGLKIPVHIDKSAFANARDYFEIRKTALMKIEKTEQHANKALKSAEIKIKRDLEANLVKHRQAGVAAQLHAIRQPHWFEKFWWFLTSTNQLVIASRDEMQRDLLLRRYFSEGDLALTSDAPDASLLIIKNPSSIEIPPQALLQAAAFCVATSPKTWESKSKAPSWFLTRKQVPKLSENGDPISIQDFRHIPNRSLIPPTPLDMGMALLWQCEIPQEKEGGRAYDKLDGEYETKSDDEEFPDTQFDSGDDFPDTNIDSDEDSDEDSNAESNDDSNDDDSSVEPNGIGNKSPQESVSHDNLTNQEAVADEVSSEDDQASNEHSDEETYNVPSSPKLSPSSSSPEPASVASAPKKVRGSKKKLRKYMYQDEEDRLAAMERLGTMKGLQRKAAEKDSKEKARKQQQDLVKQRKDRRREAELSYIKENDLGVESQPFPDDLLYRYNEDEPIIAAVPVFAPWVSIQKAQYKVKLVFGSMKKGKASSELLKVLLKTGDKAAGEREQKLVDGIRPVDVQQAIAVSRVQLATVTSLNTGKGSKYQGNKQQKGGKSSGKRKK